MTGWAILKTWKFWGVAIALLAVVATGYFAVQSYNSTIVENETLKVDIEVLKEREKALVDHQKKVDQSLADQKTTTTKIIERYNTIERDVREIPRDENPISQPVRLVLDRLHATEQEPTS